MPSGLIFGPQYLLQTQALFGEDPYPYGVKANRPMLETLVQYSHEQGFISGPVPLEELFAPATLDM